MVVATKQKDSKSAKKAKQAEHQTGLPISPSFVSLFRVVACLFTALMGYAVGATNVFQSVVEQKPHIGVRLVYSLFAQFVFTELLQIAFLQLGRACCGEKLSIHKLEPRADELAVNDNSIAWPRADLLNTEMKDFLHRKGQPFFLNHVNASRRCKDALMRMGMAIGSTVAVWYTCFWLDNRSLSSIGFSLDQQFWFDAVLGLAVGFTIVACMFSVELAAGWIQFLEFGQVFDRSDKLSVCVFWDILFHLSVAINEELPLRGWMLYSLADAFVSRFGFTPMGSFVLAMVFQSVSFVLMHLGSPGGSRVLSMLNIFIGGLAAGLNVLLTGGRLGFVMGWHFGWNISMGNIFGMSTSGIPISGTLIAIAPHPDKESKHGGVFGPEGGVVSPAAYSLGIILLALMYGMPSGAPMASS